MAANVGTTASSAAGYESEEDDWVDRPMSKEELITQGKDKDIKMGLHRVKRTKEAMEKYTKNRNGKWKPFFDAATSHVHRPTKNPHVNPKKCRRAIGKKPDFYFLARLGACADDRVEHGDDDMCDQCKKAAPKGWSGKDHTMCITVPGALKKSCVNCLYSGKIGQCSFTQEQDEDEDPADEEAEVDIAPAQGGADQADDAMEEEYTPAQGQDDQIQAEDEEQLPAEDDTVDQPAQNGQGASDDESIIMTPTWPTYQQYSTIEQSSFTQQHFWQTGDGEDLEVGLQVSNEGSPLGNPYYGNFHANEQPAALPAGGTISPEEVALNEEALSRVTREDVLREFARRRALAVERERVWMEKEVRDGDWQREF